MTLVSLAVYHYLMFSFFCEVKQISGENEKIQTGHHIQSKMLFEYFGFNQNKMTKKLRFYLILHKMLLTNEQNIT